MVEEKKLKRECVRDKPKLSSDQKKIEMKNNRDANSPRASVCEVVIVPKRETKRLLYCLLSGFFQLSPQWK